MSRPRVNIGLIGYGTVGSGVIQLLWDNGDQIQDKLGISLFIKKIGDRSIGRKEIPRDVAADVETTTDPMEVVHDPDVDMVIELVGGVEPAIDYVLQAIGLGKSVVTANKTLLAQHGPKIYEAADKHGVEFGFEASVMGTVPVIRSIGSGLAADRIRSFNGIVNGTSNYILTRMEEEGVSFLAALAEAQERGYAERDPTLDIGGGDAAQKLSILAMLAFGIQVSESDIPTRGIQDVRQEHFEMAERSNCTIKLLATARRSDEGVSLRVAPKFVSKRHPLASVRGAFNAMFVRGEASDETMYYGRGAGRMPTASAVLGDVIEIAERIVGRDKNLEVLKPRQLYWGNVPILNGDEEVAGHHLQFPVVDRPGVIGVVTSILGQHGININGVTANLNASEEGRGLLEIDIKETSYKDLRNALAVIGNNPVLQERSVFYSRIRE